MVLFTIPKILHITESKEASPHHTIGGKRYVELYG